MGTRFTRLLGAVGVSGLGDGVRQTALPLLTAAVTRNPLAVSAVAVAQALPWLLLSLLAGALVDRWDRRRVVLVANLLRAVLAVGLAALVALGAANIPVLCVAAFGFTAGETFAETASLSLFPALVPTAELERANSRLSVANYTTIEFTGPPLGGLLFAWRHAAPFLLDAVSFVLAAVLLPTIPRVDRDPPGRTNLRTEILAGLRFLFQRRLLRGLVLALAANNLLMEAVFGIFVLYALQILHVGPAEYGLLFTAYAAGGLLGGLLAVRVRGLLGDGPAVLGSMLLLGGPFLLIALAPNGYLAGVAMIVMGFGEGVWGVLTMSLRQAVVPEPLLGRVLSAFRMFGWGAGALGSGLGGVLAHAFGLRFPVLLAGIVLPVLALALGPVLSSRAITEARQHTAS